MNTTKLRQIVAFIVLNIGLFCLFTAISYFAIYLLSSDKLHDEFIDIKKYIIIDEDPLEYNEPSLEETPAEHGQRIYKELLIQNPDFIGWITIPGTRIDYPVMHTLGNEEYYLRRNFYKKYSNSGSLFCNSAANLELPSSNIVIYGHNINAGTMFHNLAYFKKQEFYDEHKKFTFDTIYRTGTYEIIGVILTDVNPGSFKYWEVIDEDEDNFNEYIAFIKKKSLYTTDGIDNVKYGDKLVTLSTCAYHIENGRLIVIGKLIESDDKSIVIN